MIVQAMTPDEVYREMEFDMPEVSRWWLRQREALVKRALKINFSGLKPKSLLRRLLAD